MEDDNKKATLAPLSEIGKRADVPRYHLLFISALQSKPREARQAEMSAGVCFCAITGAPDDPLATRCRQATFSTTAPGMYFFGGYLRLAPTDGSL